MKKRNILNSPRLLKLKRHRKKVLWGKILLSISVLLIIFTGLTFISRASALNIGEVKISGNKAIDAELIEATVEEDITGSYMWVFPKTNILLYPKNSIEENLRNKFKRLKEVNLSIKNNKVLEVSVLEREPKYVWCGSTYGVSTEQEKCSFMDANGYVFDTAPYFSGNVYFKFFGPLSEDYFSPDIFAKIAAFKDTLMSMKIKPVSLYVKDGGLPAQAGDIEMYLSSNITPKIILKKDFDLEKTSENLQTALDTEPLKSNMKNKYSSLEYIDLRFANKVYFKFR